MKLRQGCIVCGRQSNGPRCSRHPAPAPARRSYSGTAEYRRVLLEVLDAHGPSCALCGGAIDGVTSVDVDGAPGWHVDRRVDDPLVLAHVIPHADGGDFTPDNLRPAHRSCNAAAGRSPLIGGPQA